jgi:hypothetical protein
MTPLTAAAIVAGTALPIVALWTFSRWRHASVARSHSSRRAAMRAEAAAAAAARAAVGRDRLAWLRNTFGRTEQEAAPGVTALDGTCPNCGHRDEAGARFCRRCGHPLPGRSGLTPGPR